MIKLPGYTLKEEIFKSPNSTIFRADRISDKIAVIIKLMSNEYPSDHELSNFAREFEIARRLQGDGIITVYSLEKYNNSLAIIMEDFNGESVSKALKNKEICFNDKLSLALRITQALIQIHQKNIIHKDINPSNIVWNQELDLVKIIDFGISTELKRECSQCINANSLIGTLPYISPEQTGRINRPVDNRSDLYSLGVTLYELFTGELPFYGMDEVEIVHSHIAKTPVPPGEKNPELPPILSDIIMKLLSKNSEERYQSALGLKKDLEYCQMADRSRIEPLNFVPGNEDVNDRFQIPDNLYGREEEIELLGNSFERVAKGSTEFILISGYPGIGKSALVNEIRKPIASKNGNFISGKFDQFERNVPYFAFIQAFKELMQQVLAGSQQALSFWKQQLLDALGCNGQVVIDIIPELKQIIGDQPPLPELNPVEAQNRFQMTFKSFLRACAQKEHPLVIFLDDLQWSDHSSLELLTCVLDSADISHALFLGAYRDNEVEPGHPLIQFMENIKKIGDNNSSRSFSELVLKPLSEPAVNQLISDTFRTRTEDTEDLTGIIFHKTRGNPFFTNQVLNSLYQQGVFTFSPDKGTWSWDLQKVGTLEISDNVIDFLIRNLNQLPYETIEVLKYAACIGDTFDLKTIALISGKTLSSLGRSLWISIEKEIVFPLDNNYRYINIQDVPSSLEMRFCFNHDRVRQAVYSLINGDEKTAIHLKIGKTFLKQCNKSDCIDTIFDIVNQLNLGKDLITDINERIELSDLDLTAGKKAKNSTAFATALTFLESSKSLLSEDEWKNYPQKRFYLASELATCALLSGNLAKANATCDYLSEIAATTIEKGMIANIRVQILEFQARQFEAVDEIRKVLRLFGITFPESQEEIFQKIQEAIGRMQYLLQQTPAEGLVNLPEMDDPEKLMVMQLLFQVIPPALQTNPMLYILASLMMFDLSLTYGVTPLSSKCFGDCGVVQGTMLSDYKTGHKLGEAAFSMIKRFNAEALKPAVYFIFTYISHWRVHYRESLNYYDMSYKKGLETGDLLHTTYALAHKVFLQVYTGKNLIECNKETENAIVLLQAYKTSVPLLLARIVSNTIQKFLTIPDQNGLSDFVQKDNELMGIINGIKNITFLGRFFQFNTFVNIIHGDFEAAAQWNQMAENIIFAGLSDFPIPDHYLFQGLTLVNKWKSATVQEQITLSENLTKIQGKLKNWADNCPENFAHTYYLLSAQMAIIKNEPLETITGFFDSSLRSIGPEDFIQMRALINELQGVFWLQRGNEIIGKAFLREAYYLYNKWGALHKVSLLEKNYSHYFAAPDSGSHTKTTKSRTTSSNSLDITSILKSTQVISSEIKIEKLLTVLIRIIVENAGAQQGYLLLKNMTDNRLYIEAMLNMSSGQIQVMQSTLFTESNELSPEIVQYVDRTEEYVIIDDACTESHFQNTAYILKNRVKSVMCMPIIYQNCLKGIVYLENNLSTNVFTSERLEILRILSSQISISIENARLYGNMEEIVKERTLQLNNANEKLKELSLHDPLTSLHNRRYAYEFVADFSTKYLKNKLRALHNNEKRDSSSGTNVLGVFLIDIDFFKEINDTYGHLCGDTVLVSISSMLRGLIRSNDFLIRWGGEEFLIVLNDTKPDFLELFARKIITTIRETPITLSEDKKVFRTCSLGYTGVPLHPEFPEILTLEQTINLSDYALYCAKENGRNCAAHFRLNPGYCQEKNFTECLSKINKNTKLDSEKFSIQFVR
jgi:diguanylate cyclase (GGDEF)-like protein